MEVGHLDWTRTKQPLVRTTLLKKSASMTWSETRLAGEVTSYLKLKIRVVVIRAEEAKC